MTELSSRFTELICPKLNSTPAPTRTTANAVKATIQSPSEAFAPGVRSEIRASSKTGTAINTPNARESNPKPKNGRVQLASNALGLPGPGLIKTASGDTPLNRSRTSGTNQTNVSPVVNSSAMSFEGLDIANPTTSKLIVRPRTGELAAITASRIPETPTWDQVETKVPGLESPRFAILAIEWARYGKAIIAIT
jgi:hypothetical protein